MDKPELVIDIPEPKQDKPNTPAPKTNEVPKVEEVKIVKSREKIKRNHAKNESEETVEAYSAPATLPNTGSEFGIAISLLGLLGLSLGMAGIAKKGELIEKMIVWALFDSGNRSYTKGVKDLNNKGLCDVEIYLIGIDIERKNNHFINLNLADYSRLFGNNTLFDTLDKLPKPDLIIASPPCESWTTQARFQTVTLAGRKRTYQTVFSSRKGSRARSRSGNSRDYEQAYNNYKVRSTIYET